MSEISNTTEHPAKEETLAGSPALPCSASSLTPERDAIWEKHDGLSPSLAADMLLFAGKMERERNEAARLVRRLLRSHGEKSSRRSVAARSDAGLWLARFDSQNADVEPPRERKDQ